MEFKEVSKDFRRTILANSDILADKKEMSIIILNKGKAIGGCKHDKEENMVVISGKILYIGDSLEANCEMTSGQSRTIKAHEPHTFVALEESILMEWGLTAEEKKNQDKDKLHLQIINKINEV